MNQQRGRREITSQGKFILVLTFIGAILGMNFGLSFLWFPAFTLILYFIPFLRFHLSSSLEVSSFRVFSASTVTLGGFLHCRLRLINQSHNSSVSLTYDNRYSKEIILIKGWTHQRVHLNPGETRDFSFIFTFSKRGIHEFSPIIIYRGDPLGLFRESYEFDEKIEIRVIPARPQIRTDRKQKKKIRDTLVGIHAYRRRGQGDEFFSLREYIRGDEPRKIYWKGSARKGKLISKEFTDELVFRILVAVDISWTMRSRKLEYALTTLLELAEMSAQNNDAFGFVLFDEFPRKFLKPLKSPRLYEKTARLTYDQNAFANQARFETILPYIFSLKGTRGLLVIISDTEGILEEKIKSIRQLAKFGHRIIYVDLRGDSFGVVHADISIKQINTKLELDHINLTKRRTAKKYDVREKKLMSILDEIGGTYLRVDTVEQNLLLMLKKEFELEKPDFEFKMVKT
ncbi:MAG: DUF58 domain-containing protein [Candidatus Hodarchaeota archaeon]